MSKSIYMQIYDYLKMSIQQGKYKTGDRIPSEKELADMWNVSVITSRKALDLLRNDKLIDRYAGKGSFVINQVGKHETPVENKQLIGVLLTDFDESFGIGLLNGIEQELEGRANLLFRRSFGDLEKEQKCIDEFLEQEVDGLIILPSHATHFNSSILQLVVDDFPFVLVDRYLKGLGTTAVSSNNVKAAKDGADYLFDLGHESVMLLSTPLSYAIAVEDRIEGFKQAWRERADLNREASIVTEITSTLPNAFREPNVSNDVGLIKERLARHKDITAVFAMEHNIALLAKQAIEESGLRCPEDISILCFDSPPFKPGTFSFSHLLQDQEKMGRVAVEELFKMISSTNEKRTILLDAKLVEGESTKKIAARKV